MKGSPGQASSVWVSEAKLPERQRLGIKNTNTKVQLFGPEKLVAEQRGPKRGKKSRKLSQRQCTTYSFRQGKCSAINYWRSCKSFSSKQWQKKFFRNLLGLQTFYSFTLFFLLLSILVPAGRKKEVGYAGFTSAFILKNIFIMFYAVLCAKETQCLHIF